MKWKVSRHFDINIIASVIFTNFSPIKDADFTIYTTTASLSGKINWQYAPVGIGFSCVYNL